MSHPCLRGHSVAVRNVHLNTGFSRLSRASHGGGASKEVVSLWLTPAAVCRDVVVLQTPSNDFIASLALKGMG